jgi:hypothetical protein
MFPIDYDSTDGLFDRMLRGGQQRPRDCRPAREWHGPRFIGHELPLDQQLDAVRRRDDRIRVLNRPQPAPGLLAKVADAVVGMAGAAVDAVSLKGKAKAAAWLTEQLALTWISQTSLVHRG